jgi:hypothetical protein
MFPAAFSTTATTTTTTATTATKVKSIDEIVEISVEIFAVDTNAFDTKDTTAATATGNGNGGANTAEPPDLEGATVAVVIPRRSAVAVSEPSTVGRHGGHFIGRHGGHVIGRRVKLVETPFLWLRLCPRLPPPRGRGSDQRMTVLLGCDLP